MPSPARAPFLDVARGLAIALVVLHHSVIFLDAGALLDVRWRVVNDELVVLRMPLFFAVSGVLAASAARRSWRWLARHRLVLLVWLFVTWSLLRFAWFSVVPQTLNAAETATLRPLLLSPLLPVTGLWYLYALALFTVLARAAGRAAPLLLVPAAAVSLAATVPGWIAPNYAWTQMSRCFVFFLLGWCLRRVLLERFARLPGPAAWALVVAAVAGLVVHGGTDGRSPWLRLGVSVAAIGGGLAAALLLTRAAPVRPLASGLGWLGRRTLPVFLVHELVVGLLTAVAAATGAGRHPAWPPLWAAVALVTSLLVHRLARRAGLGVLYDSPHPPPRRRAAGTDPGPALGSPGAAVAGGDGRLDGPVVGGGPGPGGAGVPGAPGGRDDGARAGLR
ncbi:acyltransferase family protein [Kineococcus sp. SYSU DK004]|uniref:acyltransferase family protein n=1 Tax=Kineococcus sp. SYSU DK004 TaxID=3383125 RepID=UPI003D7CF219